MSIKRFFGTALVGSLAVGGVSVPSAWGETADWNVSCLTIDDSAAGSHFSLGGALSSTCRYRDRASGDEVEVSDAEREAVAAALSSAYAQLQAAGFDTPKVPLTSSGWRAKVYPGDCWCTKLNCCQQTDTDGDGNQVYRFRDPLTLGLFWRDAGGQIAERGELLIRSTSDAGRDVTAAHELFHAVVWGDTRPMLLGSDAPDASCLPSCWIGEGTAEAFGYHANPGQSAGWDRDWSRPLHASESQEGYQTGEFWKFLIERNGLGSLRKIFKQNYDADGRATGEGVKQVHEALNGEGVSRGLQGAYLDFIGTQRSESDYGEGSFVEVEVTEIDNDYIMNVPQIEAIATIAGRIVIDAESLDLEEQGGSLELVVEFEEGHSDLQLLVDGELVGREYRRSVSEELETGDVRRFFQVANVASQPHTSEPRAFKLKIRLREIGCPYLPTGVSKLVYDQLGPQGERLAKVVYDLTVAEEENRQTGSFDFSVTSYELGRVLTEGESKFECTDQGMIFQGTEIAHVPGFGGMEADMKLKLVTDSNYFPRVPRAGMTLPDGEVVVEGVFQYHVDLPGLRKPIGITIATQSSNRKIVAKETVQVPAGTFEAFKLTANTQATMTFEGSSFVARVMNKVKRRLERASRAQITTWYSKSIGLVKTESRNSDGVGVFQLIEVERSN